MPKDALRLFTDRYETVLPEWQERRDQYEENYRQILAHPGSGPYNSKVKTKYTHTQVLVHTAFSVAGLIPTKPWVYCEGSERYRQFPVMQGQQPMAVAALAAGREEFNRRLEEVDFYHKMFLWYRLAAIYGLGIAKLSWANGVQMELVNPADLAWDPTARSIYGDATYVIHRDDHLTMGMIRELAKDGTYDEEPVRKLGLLGDMVQESQGDVLEEERTGHDRPVPIGDDAPVTLHHMTMKDRIITVHKEADLVLRDRENGYGRIGYYDLTLYPEVFQVQGYSVPELLCGIQREKDTARQQRTDVRSLEANPMMKVRRASQLNVLAMRSAPGKIFPVNEMEDLELMQFHDTGAPLLQEEAMLEQEGDKLTGIMAHTRGERGGEMKATVATMLQTNVGTRFNTSMKVVQDYPFKHFLADFVELCTLYEKPLAISKDEWRVVRQGAQEKALRLVFHSESHVGNPFMKIQLIQQIMQMSQNVLDPQGQSLLIVEALKLAEFHDPERILEHLMPLMMGQQGAGTAVTGANKEAQGGGVAMTGEMARGRAAGQPPAARQVSMR